MKIEIQTGFGWDSAWQEGDDRGTGMGGSRVFWGLFLLVDT